MGETTLTVNGKSSPVAHFLGKTREFDKTKRIRKKSSVPAKVAYDRGRCQRTTSLCTETHWCDEIVDEGAPVRFVDDAIRFVDYDGLTIMRHSFTLHHRNC